MNWAYYVDTGVNTWLESLRIKGAAAEISATAEAERQRAAAAAAASASQNNASAAEATANRESLKFIVAAVVIGVVGWAWATSRG